MLLKSGMTDTTTPDAITVATRPSTTRWSEVRGMLSLGWPIVLTNLAQMAITTTDVVMMGWVGPEALAAGTLGANLFFALFLFGLGIALATAPMTAHALGRGHGVRDVRRTVRQGFWACVAYVVPAWVILWHAGDILDAMGQDPDLSAQASSYVRVLQWGLLPALWFVVLRCFTNALERPKPALVVTALAIALNALANYAFIFGNFGAPALGLVGAGIASTAANGFMASALLGYVYWDRRLRRYHVLARFWRPDPQRLRELLRIGLPIGVTLGFEVTVFNCAAFLMGLIGTEPLAAHAIAMQISAITFMVPMGLSQAATVRVGLAAGRGDAAGAARAGWTALAMGFAFMASMGVLLIMAPGPLIGVFLDLSDPENHRVVDLAVLFLSVAALYQVFDGAQTIGAGALRGLRDTRVPMVFAGIGYWGIGVGLGVLLAFPMGLDGLGIWIGLAAGLGSVAMLMVVRWSRHEALGLLRAAAGG
ncbi:MAG TPA: MATE family efflux transporter [Arenibaculum sp.]|nr:MATE family efflux transporter [Arenibaculum sp.]